MPERMYVWEVTIACMNHESSLVVRGIAPNPASAMKEALACDRTQGWPDKKVIGVERREELDFV